MADSNHPQTDRGQAFTLEGFVSAIIILTAILFALQAVVIAPTTGGAVDRTAMAQEEQEVRDALIVAAESGELSELVRNWDTSEEEWQNENGPGDAAYNNTRFASESDLGTILDEQFVNASGKSYNLDYIITDGTDRHVEQIVRMGGGTSDSVVSASYTITLHGAQEFMDGSGETLANSETDHGYPFSPSQPSGTAYTVVEVRVTVW